MVAQQLVVRAADRVCGLRLEQPRRKQSRQLAEPTEALVLGQNLAGAAFSFPLGVGRLG